MVITTLTMQTNDNERKYNIKRYKVVQGYA